MKGSGEILIPIKSTICTRIVSFMFIFNISEKFRLACLEEGKGLYLLNPIPQKQLIMRVQLPEGDEKQDLKTIVSQPKLYEYGVKLGMFSICN